MSDIRARLEESGYQWAGALSVKEVQEAAGLNPRFLYGKKHKDTTKLEVEAFVDAMNLECERRRNAGSMPPTELDVAKADALHWRDRHDRLATHAHLWAHRIRHLQAQVRDLAGQIQTLQKTSGKVVSLVPKKVP